MNCCCRLLKYLVFVVNFFVTVGGLALLVLATMSLITINKGVLDSEAKGDLSILYWASIVMIVLGVIMTVVGFLGCCGASRESQCLLGTYSVVMLIGIGLAVAGAVMINKERKEEIIVNVRRSVEKLFSNVNNNMKAAIAVQEALECCGANGYKDWNVASLLDQFPASCCAKRDEKSCQNPFISALTFNLGDNKYHDGCVQVAENMFRSLLDNLPVILGAAIAVQVIAFIISLVICCAIRSNTYKTTVY